MTTLIVRNPENDEDYRLQQEFFKKYPKAGKIDDLNDFYSRGVSSFTKEKLKDYKESGLLTVYENMREIKEEIDGIEYEVNGIEYEITNAEKGDTPDFISRWDGIRQRYDTIPISKKMPKSDYQSLKLGGDDKDREVLVDTSNRDIEIEMTLEEHQSFDDSIFELPKEYSKSLFNKWEHYHECYIHDKWCAHRKDKRLLKRLNKELEQGRELTEAENDLDKISIFDRLIDGGIATEVVEKMKNIFTMPEFTEELQHQLELENLWIKIDPMSVVINGDRYTFGEMSEPNPNMIKDTKRKSIHKRAKTLLEQIHDEEKKISLATLDKQFENNKRFADEYFEEIQRTPSKTEVTRLAEIINRRTSEIISYTPKTEPTIKPYQDVANFNINTFDTPFVARDLSQL